ncbi:MAG: hypothetical protein V3V65_05835, partial [Hyphomicrobium sp.]
EEFLVLLRGSDIGRAYEVGERLPRFLRPSTNGAIGSFPTLLETPTEKTTVCSNVRGLERAGLAIGA